MQFLFQPDSLAWKLLRDDPDRYIYEAVRKGVDIPLPDAIAAGISDVSKRDGWNRPADPEFALPTETWRECVARRTRCLELRQKLASGEVHSINDVITYNLNIRQLAQDVIENCYDPELIWAFYQAIFQITVLDPTCGSGAFLLAGLNILEPLYDACLERMQVFLDEGFVANNENCAKIFENFRQILQQVDSHPNRRYFILKSIIINNLYGVDIMEEATEICKLRLFLKLVSQVESEIDKPNYGLEPLPDIDFNIRAGNTLVGFANYDEVKKAVEGKLDLFSDKELINEKAQAVDQAFQEFRELQTKESGDGGVTTVQKKAELRGKLEDLRSELDRYLADEYETGQSKKPAVFNKWRESHQPFHWFVEFYGIVKRGGFDVIIGNPPYIEYNKIKSSYSLLDILGEYSTNLYSACCYRANVIKRSSGYASFIVPVSLPSTDRMQPLRILLTKEHDLHYVSFSTRPSKLFDGAEQRLAIYIQLPSNKPKLYSGGYLKWSKEERLHLFHCIEYVEVAPLEERNYIWPKIKSNIEKRIFDKILQFHNLSSSQMLGDETKLYYKNTGIRYFSTVTLRPPRCWINGSPSASSRETILNVKSEYRHAVHAFLLSSTFFFHYQSTSNCRDLNPSDIILAPVPNLSCELVRLKELSLSIEKDYIKKGKILRMQNKLTGLVELESLTPAKSKLIIDEIDRVLAQHYGFTDEELDFIINYDIKYRMGRDADDAE